MGGSLFKTVAKLAPIAAAFIPGIGPLAAAGIGAASGALSGGGLKGALLGGAGGALGAGGLGAKLAGSVGLTGLAGNVAGGALGGAIGGAGGGLKGALTSGALGGLGGYYQGGGFDGLLGNAAGTSLDVASGVPGLQGPTAGTGISGALGRAASSIGLDGIGAGSAGAGSSSYSPLTSIASGLIGTNTNDETQQALLEQQRNSLAAVQPFLNQEFTPGDLTQDPGYQFRLSQGQSALDRQQAAKGNYFSGQALKEAQDYGQGLADSTYNDAYTRFLQNQQQKLSATGQALGVYDNIGNINAGAATNQGNLLTGSLAGLLGGTGLSNTGEQMGTSGALGSSNGIITIAGKQYLQNNGQLIPIG